MLRTPASVNLREGFSLRLNPDACLPLRSRYSDCTLCVDICPAKALKQDDGLLALAEHCTACGRCVAVCPTRALRLEAPGPAAPAGLRLEFECERIPVKATGHAVRVSCTGALSTADLLKHCADSPEGRVTIVDRGLCSECPSGGPDCHPAAAAVSLAASLIEEVTGRSGRTRVSIEERPLPPSIIGRPVAEPAHEVDPARRRFLRRATGLAQAGAASRRLPGLRAPVTGTPRQQVIESLRRLASRTAGVLPAALFPVIEIADSCRDHGICAATCPTGALRRYEEGGTRGVAFDAAACIACGVCASACPERAIRLLPARASGDAPAGIERLTRHDRRQCTACGGDFVAAGARATCPACEKTKDLFSTGTFGNLFRAPRLAGEPQRAIEPGTQS